MIDLFDFSLLFFILIHEKCDKLINIYIYR
jgi:hypothetical protein